MDRPKGITVSKRDHGICEVRIDLPDRSVNLISPNLLNELSQALDSIESDLDIRGVIFLSSKPDHFIGGAEIDVQKFLADMKKTAAFLNEGRAVFHRISRLRPQTMAAIHGACLGGGLELALACRHRMASDHFKTRMGFPEVMLGILPAWGGTTRLPRLIGLTASLDLLLTGKQIDAKRALRMGLIDRVVPSKEIPLQSNRFMSELLDPDGAAVDRIRSIRKRTQNRVMTKFMDRTGLGRAVLIAGARKKVLKLTHGRYPAPLQIIQVLQKGLNKPMEDALGLEQEAMITLLHKEVTRNLLHVFSLKMHAGKLPPASEPSGDLSPVRRVGVIGAGAMGAGIAQWLVHQRIRVRMRDINEDAIARGLKIINGLFDRQVSRHRMKPEDKKDRLRFLSTTSGYSGFSTCDLVIEAAAETIEIKKKILSELEESTGRRMIFATNTSSLSVSEMAEGSKSPDRVLGLHFFNPVAKMPLVEVIRGRQTSDETLSAGVAFVKRIGKTPVVVSDSPGFLVNRILMAYANEAALLLEEGAAVDQIDHALEAFGMPMGPFMMMDGVGLDIAHHTAASIRSALRLDTAQQARMGDQLYEMGHLGKKTGQGFFDHRGSRRTVNQPIVDSVLDKIRVERGISIRRDITDNEITDRLVLIMANTAAWCLENRLIEGPGDVDLGIIMGAGFPPFRGGILRYCDKLGIPAVKDSLERIAGSRGDRFSPSPYINDLHRRAIRFYHPS